MFKVTYSDLTVYEGHTGFWIYQESDPSPNNEHCLGDGVDMFTDENGESIMVSTPEFYALLTTDLVTNYDDYMEAYFDVWRTS
jgi:hypothetical protein